MIHNQIVLKRGNNNLSKLIKVNKKVKKKFNNFKLLKIKWTLS